MLWNQKSLPLLALALPFLAGAAPTLEERGDVETIETEVVVIGGGSSGTYAAIRLQQEGKQVVLIEKQDQLGGHVDTYHDATTNQTFDFGVQVFSNISVVQNYFAHFGIPLVPVPATQSVTLFADFETGSFAYNKTLVDAEVGEAMVRYDAEMAKYPGITESPTWNLTYPVPEDLLLDWGDFIKKYQLEAFAYTAFSYQQGFGNLLAQPTLYQMRLFDRLQVQSILTPGGFVVNALQNNQLLYDAAQQELGENVFVSSCVLSVDRSGEDDVEVWISTPGGHKLIKAEKLLIAIPPKVENLAPFLDLTAEEAGIFGQFNNSYYWTSIVKNTGFDDATTFGNVDPAAPLDLPPLPGIYGFNPTGIPNTRSAYFGSPYYLSNEEVEQQILDTIDRVREGLGYPEPASAPEVAILSAHNPFELTVSKDAIRGGFYQDLEALQGKSKTWWTSATWNKHASHSIWAFTEAVILPALLA